MRTPHANMRRPRRVRGELPRVSMRPMGAAPVYIGSHQTASFWSRMPRPLALAAVGALVVVLGVFVVPGVLLSAESAAADQSGLVGPLFSSEEEDAQSEPASTAEYAPSIESLDAIADPGTNITGFSLAAEGTGRTPSLEPGQHISLEAALLPFSYNERTVGFCFFDLQTGSGYAYNIDAELYGASSFKGPFFIYACQEVLEPGNRSISSIDQLAADTITWSDNTSYYRLRRACDGYGSVSLEHWLSNLHVDPSLANDTAFPHYTPRDSLKLWMNAYQYLESGDPEIVEWAQQLLGSTERSMIRDAVAPKEDGTEIAISIDESSQGAERVLSAADSAYEAYSIAIEEPSEPITVYDKAGWISGEDTNATIDAGIIVEGDRAYPMTIMTDVPESETNDAFVSGIAKALWNARGTLGA